MRRYERSSTLLTSNRPRGNRKPSITLRVLVIFGIMDLCVPRNRDSEREQAFREICKFQTRQIPTITDGRLLQKPFKLLKKTAYMDVSSLPPRYDANRRPLRPTVCYGKLPTRTLRAFFRRVVDGKLEALDLDSQLTLRSIQTPNCAAS